MLTLSGLSEATTNRMVLFSLTLLCYFVILMINSSLILTIILDQNLHQPMYIFLCNLCLNALYGTAGFYPKFLFDLLYSRHVISFGGCIVQSLVIYSSICVEYSILALMAYDRTCVKSIESRGKFMQTCLPHLLTLLNVTVAVLFDLMFMRYVSKN
ncbi:hypothetical protein CRUP_024357 [Coryphaenoides rupestris]|nr:hypothetical protein CRUP_024357 [Coryphaenoides rupestris]